MSEPKRTRVVMTAAELLTMARNAPYANAADVHRVLGEVWRLRGKLRSRDERIRDLERELSLIREMLGGCPDDESDSEIPALGCAAGFGARQTGKG